MSISNRVKMALIGFSGLLVSSSGAYDFDSVCAAAVSDALEDEGLSSEPGTDSPSSREMVFCRACLNALDAVESILVLMPIRQRIEVGIETEKSSFSTGLKTLRENYQKRYDRARNSGEFVQTFTIKDGVDLEDEDTVDIYRLPGMS